MRVCPTCQSALPDEAMFCPIDGTALARREDDPLVGSVLSDRFLVTASIGRGSSGLVYCAEDLKHRRWVALKVLHAQLGGGEASVRRYRDAVTALAQIPNDHHTRLVEAGSTGDGRVFVAMELLEGETLAARLAREGRLALEHALDVVAQVADGLADSHARGWCHGDLRPANLYLVARPGAANFVKILDLGLAWLVRESARAHLALTVGDERYLAPEQVRREPGDPRTDVFALGLVAYEAVVGERPFGGAQAAAIRQGAAPARPPPPSARVGGVPAQVDAAILRALAMAPADRFPDTLRLAAAVRVRVTAPVPDFRPTTSPLGARPEAAAPAPSELAAAFGAASTTPAAAPPPPPIAPPPVPGAAYLSADRAPPPGPPSRDAVDASDTSAFSVRWFGEGEAASRAVERGVTRTSELPAMYARLESDESDDHARAPSKGRRAALIAGGVATGALVIGLVVAARYAVSGDYDARARAAAAHESSPLAPGANPLAPPRPIAPERPAEGGEPDEPPARVPDPIFQPLPSLLGDDRGAPAEGAPADERPGGDRAAPVPAPAPQDAPARAASREPRREAAPGGGEARDRAEDAEAAPARTAAEPPPDRAPAGRAASSSSESARAADEHARVGQEHMRRGGFAEAAAAFRKALDLDPNNVVAVAGLAELAFEQGYYAQAIDRLDVAVRLRPRSARYLVMLGHAHFKLDHVKSAIEFYRRALDIEPSNAEAQNGLQVAQGRL